MTCLCARCKAVADAVEDVLTAARVVVGTERSINADALLELARALARLDAAGL